VALRLVRELPWLIMAGGNVDDDKGGGKTIPTSHIPDQDGYVQIIVTVGRHGGPLFHHKHEDDDHDVDDKDE